jgi:hypothetical protein
MQPLGRKKIQLPDAKHDPKSKGKHIGGWWENIVNLSKTAARFKTKKEIKVELSNEINSTIL